MFFLIELPKKEKEKENAILDLGFVFSQLKDDRNPLTINPAAIEIVREKIFQDLKNGLASKFPKKNHTYVNDFIIGLITKAYDEEFDNVSKNRVIVSDIDIYQTTQEFFKDLDTKCVVISKKEKDKMLEKNIKRTNWSSDVFLDTENGTVSRVTKIFKLVKGESIYQGPYTKLSIISTFLQELIAVEILSRNLAYLDLIYFFPVVYKVKNENENALEYITQAHMYPGELVSREPVFSLFFPQGRTNIKFNYKLFAISFYLGLSSLEILHKQNILHGDIRIANMLFCPSSLSFLMIDLDNCLKLGDSYNSTKRIEKRDSEFRYGYFEGPMHLYDLKYINTDEDIYVLFIVFLLIFNETYDNLREEEITVYKKRWVTNRQALSLKGHTGEVFGLMILKFVFRDESVIDSRLEELMNHIFNWKDFNEFKKGTQTLNIETIKQHHFFKDFGITDDKTARVELSKFMNPVKCEMATIIIRTRNFIDIAEYNDVFLQCFLDFFNNLRIHSLITNIEKGISIEFEKDPQLKLACKINLSNLRNISDETKEEIYVFVQYVHYLSNKEKRKLYDNIGLFFHPEENVFYMVLSEKKNTEGYIRFKLFLEELKRDENLTNGVDLVYLTFFLLHKISFAIPHQVNELPIEDFGDLMINKHLEIRSFNYQKSVLFLRRAYNPKKEYLGFFDKLVEEFGLTTAQVDHITNQQICTMGYKNSDVIFHENFSKMCNSNFTNEMSEEQDKLIEDIYKRIWNSTSNQNPAI